MKLRFSERENRAATRFGVVGLIAGLLLLPTLIGCPGTLDPAFKNGLSGSGGMTGGGSGGSGPACDAPTQVFRPSCSTQAVCHKPPGSFDPDFSGAQDLTKLLASTSKAPCAGKPIIDKSNLASSPIMLRISGSTCGDQMPDKVFDATVQYLSQTDIDCVMSWISAQ